MLDKVVVCLVVCLVVLGQEVNCLSGMLGQESVYLVVLVKKNCLSGGVGSRGCVVVCLLAQVYWVKRMSVWNVRSGDCLEGSVTYFLKVKEYYFTIIRSISMIWILKQLN